MITLQHIKRGLAIMLHKDISDIYSITPIYSDKMNRALSLWDSMRKGTPPWISEDVKSVSFQNTIARELSRLITLNIDIKVDGSDDLQEALDSYFLQHSQGILEQMITMGGVCLKYNGVGGFDLVSNDDFIPTATDANGKITGAIFTTRTFENGFYYTRTEYHRYEGETYKVSNRVFRSKSASEKGRECSLAETRWKEIQKEVEIQNLEKPLFVYLKNPFLNTIDGDSPLGISLFSECIEELRWLDIAISSLGVETEDSKPVLFIDTSALEQAKSAGIEMPRYVRSAGDSMNMESRTLHQWTPQLQVQNRKEGINFYLSLISYKCGFDPGYFVFNGQTVQVATATQVEATERRTVNTVLSYRALLDRPLTSGDGRGGYITDLLDILQEAGAATGTLDRGTYGQYKVFCSFKDLTINEEEDKAFDFTLMNAGLMSKWRFLVRRMGLTEAEAKQMIREATEEALESMPQGLFTEEEGAGYGNNNNQPGTA